MLGKKQIVSILKDHFKDVGLINLLKISKGRTYGLKEVRRLFTRYGIDYNEYPILKDRKITGRPKQYTDYELKERNRNRVKKYQQNKRLNKK